MNTEEITEIQTITAIPKGGVMKVTEVVTAAEEIMEIQDMNHQIATGTEVTIGGTEAAIGTKAVIGTEVVTGTGIMKATGEMKIADGGIKLRMKFHHGLEMKMQNDAAIGTRCEATEAEVPKIINVLKNVFVRMYATV